MTLETVGSIIKQGRKRPLDTPKRRERKVEVYRYREGWGRLKGIER